jgi:hypothetical protein
MSIYFWGTITTLMIKEWKWIVGILFAICAIVAVTAEEHYTRDKYEAKRQEDCIALAVSPEEKHSCAKEAQNRHDYVPWGHELLTWPEGITTWALILTLGAFIWQATLMEKHAAHLKDLAGATKDAATATKESAASTKASADAALKQIKNAVTSERPWIDVRISETDLEYGKLKFVAKNRGNSPAKITMYMAERINIPEAETSDRPKYSVDGRFDEAQWRLPGDEFSVREFPFGSSEQYEAQKVGRFVLFQGFVRYEDTLTDDIHETRFCYQAFVPEHGFPGIRMFKAKGYNTMT